MRWVARDRGVIGTYLHIQRARPIFGFGCTDNHNVLPNIVGPWFPLRDGEESTKPFYYVSMLTLLKPWHDLRALKDVDDDWKTTFDGFMENGKQ